MNFSFFVILLSLFKFISSDAAPNLLDAPNADAGKEIPSVLAGKPKPLLDEEGQKRVYDLATSVTDEDADNSNLLWVTNK